MNEELLCKELTYKVIGLGMQVHTVLGHGFLEKVYENSLMVLFRKAGIFAEQHKAQTLNYFKATGLELALILNFGTQSFEHHRLINRLSKPENLNNGLTQIFAD